MTKQHLLPDTLKLPHAKHFRGEVILPGSKSISNRALLLAALAQGTTTLENLLDSDDTQHMRTALRQLGVEISDCKASTCTVQGLGKPFATERPLELFLGNAGTAMRPLIAVLAASTGEFTLTGEPRMYERPAGPLVEALVSLGADIKYTGEPGFPPMRIKGKGTGRLGAPDPLRDPDTNNRGAQRVEIDGSLSSQYVSALLMLLPLLKSDTELVLKGEVVSLPYIQLTIEMMRQFGVKAEFTRPSVISIPGNQNYQSPGTYFVESDASSASYFLAAGAIGGGPVRVLGIGKDSLQGDKDFASVLEQMGAQVKFGSDFIEVSGSQGVLKGGNFDLNAIPDAAMTIATTALFASSETVIRNVYNWRLKETDRLHAMATELRKAGAVVEEWEDGLRIQPPAELQHATIDTYDDHRMAMCFALLSFAPCSVTINDPGCCSKTYPDFFDDFSRYQVL